MAHLVAVPWDDGPRPELTARRVEVTHGVPASCVLLGPPPAALRCAHVVRRPFWDGRAIRDRQWFEETARALISELERGVVAVVAPTEALRRLFRRADLQNGYPSSVTLPNAFDDWPE